MDGWKEHSETNLPLCCDPLHLASVGHLRRRKFLVLRLEMDHFLNSIAEFTNESSRVALFSVFKERELNPEGWDWKFAFWKRIIADAMRKGLLGGESVEFNRFCFSKNLLERMFSFHGSYPLVFDTVISKLKLDNDIKEESLFKQSAILDQPNTFTNKLYRLAKYASSLLRLESTSTAIDANQSFVFTELVLQYVTVVQEWIGSNYQSLCDSVFTEAQLKATIGSLFVNLNSSEIETIFQCMLIEGKIYSCTLENGLVVYYVDKNNSLKLISAIGLLKGSIDSLNAQAEKLEESLVGIQQKLSTLVQEKRRNAALVELKRKHAVEKNLERIRKSVATMEGQLLSIDAAETETFLYDSMTKGLQVGKEILARTNIDEYSDLTFELKQLKEEQQELSQALSSPIDSQEGDEEEIEKEYQQLLAEEKSAVELEDVMKRLGGLQVEKSTEKTKKIVMT